jgi:uncharacterized membrane protein
MRNSEATWSDERIRAIIGNLLRAGVLIAAAVTLIGGVIYLAHSGESVTQYHAFHGEPADLRGVKGVWSDAFFGDGLGIMQLGLLLLIATPVARVAFSLFAFAMQRDRLYVVVTLAVLGVLAFSMTGGTL